jgi:cobalt/nickel transport system permease protein
MKAGVLSVSPSRAWLSRLDPRARVLVAIGFAMIVVTLNSLSLLMLALSIAIAVSVAAGLRVEALVGRLLALETFMLVLCCLLPFTVSGENWFRLGPFDASWNGLMLALTILLKANAIVLLLLTLVGSLEPIVLGHTLARLRLPEKLVHLLLFTIRYLAVLSGEYSRLRRAMSARGFRAKSDRHSWRALGWLIGMLLVRSQDRAERIVKAMQCRGFNGHCYLLSQQQWNRRDTYFSLSAVFVMSFLLAINSGLL